MLKCTKSALGLLRRQYSSVLIKCAVLNLALMIAIAPANAADNPKALSNAPVTQVVTTNMNNHLFAAINNKLRGEDLGHKTETSSNDMWNGMSMWADTYYGYTKLDNRPETKGFDIDTMGGIVGMEKQMTAHMRIGAGYQYDAADVNGHKRKTKAKSSTGFIYAEYQPNAMFLNGMIAYGQSTYRDKNHAPDKTIRGKYHADMLSMQALSGYKYSWNMIDLTPQMGLRYNYIKRHGYKDGANQYVSGKNMDIFTGLLGLQISKDLYWHECLKFRPELYGGMSYDFVSNRDNAIVKVAGGEDYVVKGKRLNHMGFQVGAGITSELTEKLTMNLSYLGNFRRDFYDNSGILGLSYAM